MTDNEAVHGPGKRQRDKPVVRDLSATITLNGADVRGLLAELQQPVIDAVSAKLAAIEKPVAPVDAPPPPAITEKPASGITLPEAERLKATDLRSALLMGKVPETAGLLIDTPTTAMLLNVSPRTLRRLDAVQAIPQPMRIGSKIIRWRLAEILEWMDAGCPPRRAWTYPHEFDRSRRRR